MFYKKQKTSLTILIVYVDDIVLTEDDKVEIHKTKCRLAKEFDMKDLWTLRYFSGMEIARNKSAISISQQK